jgi:hypothetical protein
VEDRGPRVGILRTSDRNTNGDKVASRTTGSQELPTTVRTCGEFRVNADRNELVDAILRHTRASAVSDLYLRTWGGKLILDSGRLEVRVDAEGKIDGFSVIPFESLQKLALLRSSGEKYTNLICEGFDLKILGLRVKTPRKVVLIEYVRSVLSDAVQTTVKRDELSVQEANRSEGPPLNQEPVLDADQEMTSLRAVLKLAESMTATQLAESGLSEIVAAAKLKRDKLIQEAADLLRPLDITATQLFALLK